MTETAGLSVDEVLPRNLLRQWLLSVPFALRFLLLMRPEVLTQVLGNVVGAISGHFKRTAGFSLASAETGAGAPGGAGARAWGFRRTQALRLSFD